MNQKWFHLNSIFMHLLTSINIILGTMITLSSSSWMTAWLGMELNLLSFMPWMKSKNYPNSTEASMKYFLIQTISSSLFIFITLQFSIMNFLLHILLLFLILTLAMKMAIAPLHFWLPSLAHSLAWKPLLMILTWQKIAPLSIISSFYFNFSFLIYLNLLLGCFMMLNQNSIKKLLIYSSISHMGWMISSIKLSINILILYTLMYLINTISLILLLQISKIYYINHIPNSNKTFTLIMMLTLVSMTGFPPFLMFFPKLMVISGLTYFKFNFILIFILLVSSFISMFSYLQMLWPILLNFSYFSKFMNINMFSLKKVSFFFIFMPLFSLLPLFTLLL